jgi:hypothetical protein
MAKSIRAASTPTPTQQSELDDALDDTFPASDPPSMTDPTHGVRASHVTLDDEAIRNRAYEIWQKAGYPDSSHEEHWAQAQNDPGTYPRISVASSRRCCTDWRLVRQDRLG